jgi:hypothetical protein
MKKHVNNTPNNGMYYPLRKCSIMLNEVTQVQKVKDFMFSLICGRYTYKLNVYINIDMTIYMYICVYTYMCDVYTCTYITHIYTKTAQDYISGSTGDRKENVKRMKNTETTHLYMNII